MNYRCRKRVKYSRKHNLLCDLQQSYFTYQSMNCSPYSLSSFLVVKPTRTSFKHKVAKCKTDGNVGVRKKQNDPCKCSYSNRPMPPNTTQVNFIKLVPKEYVNLNTCSHSEESMATYGQNFKFVKKCNSLNNLALSSQANKQIANGTQTCKPINLLPSYNLNEYEAGNIVPLSFSPNSTFSFSPASSVCSQTTTENIESNTTVTTSQSSQISRNYSSGNFEKNNSANRPSCEQSVLQIFPPPRAQTKNYKIPAIIKAVPENILYKDAKQQTENFMVTEIETKSLSETKQQIHTIVKEWETMSSTSSRNFNYGTVKTEDILDTLGKTTLRNICKNNAKFRASKTSDDQLTPPQNSTQKSKLLPESSNKLEAYIQELKKTTSEKSPATYLLELYGSDSSLAKYLSNTINSNRFPTNLQNNSSTSNTVKESIIIKKHDEKPKIASKVNSDNKNIDQYNNFQRIIRKRINKSQRCESEAPSTYKNASIASSKTISQDTFVAKRDENIKSALEEVMKSVGRLKNIITSSVIGQLASDGLESIFNEKKDLHPNQVLVKKFKEFENNVNLNVTNFQNSIQNLDNLVAYDSKRHLKQFFFCSSLLLVLFTSYLIYRFYSTSLSKKRAYMF